MQGRVRRVSPGPSVAAGTLCSGCAPSRSSVIVQRGGLNIWGFLHTHKTAMVGNVLKSRLLHHLLWLMRHRRSPALIGDVAKGVPACERLHLFAALLLQLLLLLAQLGRVGPIIGDEELLLKCIGVNDEHPDVRPHTRPRDATQTSSPKHLYSVFCILYSVIFVRGNGVIHRGQKPASRG